MKKSVYAVILVFAMFVYSCRTSNNYHDNLKADLERYVKDRDAHIGIAIIVDGSDTISVNGNQKFPMFSVYKFPIALALGDYCRRNGLSLDDSVTISRSDIRDDTYSPMIDKYRSIDTTRISFRELLAYSLQQSDNNASDIILKAVDGTGSVRRYLNDIGCTGINVMHSEAEMHGDMSLWTENSATPLAMAALIDKFVNESNDTFSEGIKKMMETCQTGNDRLAAALIGENVVLGHKTGTGFSLPDGGESGVNDAGYVLLPDGRRYAIAVFVENSPYDMASTSAIIADISAIAYRHIAGSGKQSSDDR